MRGRDPGLSQEASTETTGAQRGRQSTGLERKTSRTTGPRTSDRMTERRGIGTTGTMNPTGPRMIAGADLPPQRQGAVGRCNMQEE